MSTSSALDHQRLLHFLATVKQIGHLPPNGSPALMDGKNEQGRLWADLPFFKPTLTAMLRTTFHDQRDRVPYHGLQEWRALNTLAARLSVCEAHDLRVCAVIAMRDVLEEQQTDVTADMLEVVALWLSTQGYWLEAMAAYSVVSRKFYESPSKWFVYRLEEVSVTPGRLAGDAGVAGEDVSLPRWRFWRTRLQALAGAEASTSPLAASALGRMIDI